MITGVFFNDYKVRLGEHKSLGENDFVVKFGGSIFVRTGEEAVLDEGGLGKVYFALFLQPRTLSL